MSSLHLIVQAFKVDEIHYCFYNTIMTRFVNYKTEQENNTNTITIAHKDHQYQMSSFRSQFTQVQGCLGEELKLKLEVVRVAAEAVESWLAEHDYRSKYLHDKVSSAIMRRRRK